MSPQPREKFNVAIVAPSPGILGGQPDQADQLRRAWDDDPKVRARLVAIYPTTPRPLRHALAIKYVRTPTPGLASRLTVAARRTCEQYRWERVGAQWLSLYRGLARAVTPPAPLRWPTRV
jgi:hypothetical protein